jgi:hypothetical protein
MQVLGALVLYNLTQSRNSVDATSSHYHTSRFGFIDSSIQLFPIQQNDFSVPMNPLSQNPRARGTCHITESVKSSVFKTFHDQTAFLMRAADPLLDSITPRMLSS